MLSAADTLGSLRALAARRSSAAAASHTRTRCLPLPHLQSAAPSAWSGDLLVLGVHEGAFETAGEGEAAVTSIASADLTALDAKLGGAIADIVASFEFKGKAVRLAGWL